MKYALRIAPLLLVLSLTGGCASTGGNSTMAGPAASSASSPPAEEALPEVELSGELLFRLLGAEFGMLWQHYEFAAEQYLVAALDTRDPRLAEQAARIALLARYDDIARSASLLWVELLPEDIYAREAVVSALIRNGEVDRVQPYLSALLKSKDTGDEEAFRLVSLLTGQERDLDAAVRALQIHVEAHPDNFAGWYVFGYLAFRAEQLPLAADAMQRALQLRRGTTDGVVQVYLGILKKQGRFADAAAFLERQIKKQPASSALHLTFARLLLEMRRVDEAKREFDLALKYDPQNQDVLFALALLTLQENRPDEAEKYLLRLQKTGRDGDQVAYFLGQMEEQRSNAARAIAYYSQVGHEAREYIEAQIRIVVLQARNGEIEAARTRLQVLAGRFYEQRKQLMHIESELLYEAGLITEALEVLNRALEEFSGDIDLLFSRALAYDRLERIADAERDLKQILKTDESNVTALNALGFVLADKTNRFQEAYDYIKRALELSPNDASIIDSMGWVLYRLGDLEGAEQYLRRALSFRMDYEISAHLGEVLWMMGRHDEAKQVWSHAHREAPEHELLNEVMKRFGQLQ